MSILSSFAIFASELLYFSEYPFLSLEAEAGIEPAHGGFAIRNITTLLLGLNESYCNVRTRTYQGFF
jgi:hypothetical protein